jgi:proliferating cell nuclear antigen
LIELKKVDLWKKSVEAVSTFIAEGNFRFNEKGIEFKAIDPSQIVFVDYLMKKSVFDKFEIEPNFVGVDLVELNKVMSRALPNDRLVMNLTDSELLVRLEGDLIRAFHLPLIDLSEEEVNIPSYKFDAKVEIPGKVLKEALKDASLLGSSVVVKVNGKEFVLEARGSAGSLNISSKNSKGISVEAKQDVVSKYSLNFFQNLVKEADPEKKVVIELKTDSPMKVSYPIGENEIRFYLAHMIL